jgi:hypothetical protein
MLAIALAAILGSVGSQASGIDPKVATPDAEGKLPVSQHPSKMKVNTSVAMDLGESRKLVVCFAGDFATRQLRALGLFDEVISNKEAESLIISKGLQESVLSMSDGVGQYMFAKKYKPYLVVTAEHVTRKNPNKASWLVSDEYESFVQLRVTDPLTQKVVFEAEIEEDFRWKGVREKNTYYPLMNLLVDWVRQNSGGAPAAPAPASAAAPR